MRETVLGRERLPAARRREDEYIARAVQQSDELASKRVRIADLVADPVPPVGQCGADSNGNVTIAPPVVVSKPSKVASPSVVPLPPVAVPSLLVPMDDSQQRTKRTREPGDEGD